MKKQEDPKHPANPGGQMPAVHHEIKPNEYLRAVRSRLRDGRQKDAYAFLLQATAQYPDDPLILSYYGCLQAVVDKKFRSGVETCKRAVLLLKKKEVFSEEVLYPVFYLNLGRANVAAGRKKDAIDAFKKGLRYDGRNSDLLQELQGLGVRKQPPLPFLARSNPLNIYIGKILHKVRKGPHKPTRDR